MTDHTPELTAVGDKIYGETPEDGIIARVYGDEDLAARFVAAYNACAGIPTERLKPGSVAKAVDALDEIGHGAPWGGPAEDHVKFMRETAVAAFAPFQGD